MKGKCISKQKQWEETFFFVQHPMNSWLSKPRILLHLATQCVLNSTRLIPESLYNPELVTIFWYLSHLLCKVGRIVWLPTQLTKTRTSGRFDAFFKEKKVTGKYSWLLWEEVGTHMNCRYYYMWGNPSHPHHIPGLLCDRLFLNPHLWKHMALHSAKERTLTCFCVFACLFWSDGAFSRIC